MANSSPADPKAAGALSTTSSETPLAPGTGPQAPNPYPYPYAPYPAPYPYPYAAPPPTQPYYANGASSPPPFFAPPYYSTPPPSRHPFYFLHRLLCIFIILFTISTLITFIVLIALSPRLPDISVTGASVTGLDTSAPGGQLLSSQFNVTFAIHNPSGKMSIAYDMVSAAAFYRGEVVGQISLPPFEQGKGNDTVLDARIVTAGEYVGSDVVRGINEERGKGDGSVGFDFGIYAWVKYEAGTWETRREVMKASCDHILIGVNRQGAGSLVELKPKKCMVQI